MEIKYRQAIYYGDKFGYWHWWGFIEGEFRPPLIHVGVGWSKPEESQQYTGLYSRSNIEIYAGDIVKFRYYRKEVILPVEWGTDGWWVSAPGWFKHLYWVADKCEVVGTIHENPELI